MYRVFLILNEKKVGKGQGWEITLDEKNLEQNMNYDVINNFILASREVGSFHDYLFEIAEILGKRDM